MRVDLHLHTTKSDGSLTPGALARSAVAGRLDVIAVTDHDTVAGIEAAQLAAVPALRIIPGIEVSSTFDSGELHILGYYIDPAAPALVEHSRLAVDGRKERLRGMIRKLENLGVSVGYEEVMAAAGPESSAIGRPHLARVLVQRGLVGSFAEAFDRFLGDGGPAFLPTELVTPRQAIDLIHAAKGLAVWAHPPIELYDREATNFADWGLDGVECFRPRSLPTETLFLKESAHQLGLVVTGGSDWHGAWHGRLGEFYLQAREVAEFLELGGIVGQNAAASE